MTQKTCFVIIGYGIKTDYPTGRQIDLDKTYKNIIEPVFKEMGFLCFRASDIQHSGMIDLPMYENILKADFVVADLTTLNPNVLYELGIRHAVKKNTTIVISENELKYPFDLSHILIEKYEHLGKAIDHDEVIRFREVLQNKVLQLLKHPKIDSPIYTIFPALQTPSFTKEEIDEIKESKESEESLSDILAEAEIAKENLDYTRAIELLETAKEMTKANDFIIQRLALATYKSKKPNTLDALFRAELILDELEPSNSTNLETLALMGAINKRIYEELNEVEYLEKALRYYKRGYYIGNDYYNGINTAYLLVLKSILDNDKFEAYANFGEAKIIRREVIHICNSLIGGKIWEERDDQEWIFLTLAEAHLANGNKTEAQKAIELGHPYLKGEFSISSFSEQKEKLLSAIELFHNKYF